MKRTLVLSLALAAFLTAAINVPAFGGTSLAHKVGLLSKRVTKLQRRVNTLAVLEANHDVTVVTANFPTAGATQGSAFCGANGDVVGGGASWAHPLTNDAIITSRPNGAGWFVQMGPHPLGDVLTVFAVCSG